MKQHKLGPNQMALLAALKRAKRPMTERELVPVLAGVTDWNPAAAALSSLELLHQRRLVRRSVVYSIPADAECPCCGETLIQCRCGGGE